MQTIQKLFIELERMMNIPMALVGYEITLLHIFAFVCLGAIAGYILGKIFF